MFIAFVGWEKNNKYVLKNSSGQQFFYAMEGLINYYYCYSNEPSTYRVNLSRHVLILFKQFPSLFVFSFKILKEGLLLFC